MTLQLKVFGATLKEPFSHQSSPKQDVVFTQLQFGFSLIVVNISSPFEH